MKHVATAVIIIGLLSAAVSVLFFALAFRPCRIALEPGQVVTYRLKSITTELPPAGTKARDLPSRSDERELTLICVGANNDVALINDSGAAAADAVRARDVLSLLRLGEDGSARLLDAAGRPSDRGRAIGFFDFNLLPLPTSSEQTWEAGVTYAVLPPGKRLVQAKAARARSGTRTELTLRFPTSIEWLDQGRYRQVRDLSARYVYATSRNLIERADLKLTAGVERDDAQKDHRFAIAITLELIGSVRRGEDDAAALREAAIACAEAQDALAQNRVERAPSLIGRLQQVQISQPRLRKLAARLADDLADPARAGAAPPSATARIWAVQVASGPAAQRPAAEQLTRRLIDAGFPAFIAPAGARANAITVLVGRYRAADPALLAELARRFPGTTPTWVEVMP